MQFQIPQFIETEDKIVGPFSLKQFLYIGGSVGTSMLFYFVLNFWVWLPLSIIIVGAGMGFGLIKINGRPLTILVTSAAKYFWEPRTYVWQSDKQLPETSTSGEKSGFSLEKIAAGFSLAQAWESVQTGTVESKERATQSLGRLKERYQIFDKISGDRAVAKRVDYR